MGGCYSKNLRTPEKEHSCSGEKASKFRCGYLGLGPDLRLYCCEKKTPLETEGLKTPLCPHRSRSVHCLAGGGGGRGGAAQLGTSHSAQKWQLGLGLRRSLRWLHCLKGCWLLRGHSRSCPSSDKPGLE